MRQIIINISGDSYHLVYTKSNDQITPVLSEELITSINHLVQLLNGLKTPTEKAIEYIQETADDETLLSMYDIFPPWQIDRQYAKDMVLRFNGDLWRVLQAHRSQADWIPPDAVSLYVRITPPGVIEPWRQPQGAHDAYQKGDKVTHKGKTWESTVNDNVWEPGVYGWEIATKGV